ncbi:hypothetical protein PAXINDRAFT_157708 [Paxillus involutus ATCC 200175]|uniref:Uncharacterized protein n=1 Tax=Paxillus involutus ATCC 200175 TaxID=664439 RepID=A0A0C9TQQ3_PAXIN|nr:hypothetical protein PAXINDRAFT_157708 [Paxillus involutus ATCC 200175]
MHLLGSIKQKEINVYMKAYHEDYFKEVIQLSEIIVSKPTSQLSEADITQPVLKNIITKLQWFNLGFHPSKKPYIKLTTPYPIFIRLTMPSIMINRNSTAIGSSKHEKGGQEVDFSKTILKVNVVLHIPGDVFGKQLHTIWNFNLRL